LYCSFEETKPLPPEGIENNIPKKQPMLTVQNYISKKNRTRQRNTLHGNNPKPFSDPSLMKKNASTKTFLKRLSPFLVTVIVFPLLIIYTTVKDVHIFENMLLQVLVFSFIEFNLLLLDFALWNYFGGKKITRIWAIELTTVSAVIYFLL